MRFEYTDTVARDPDAVFALITDIDRKHEWVGEVVASRKTSAGPTTEGTTYVDIVRFMGRTSEIPTIITRYEPGCRLSYRHIEGPIKGELDFMLAAAGTGTQITVSIDADVPAYMRVLGPLLSWRLRSQMDANFAALTQALERSGPADGSAGDRR